MFYSFGDRVPQILGDNFFVADSASVIGSVTIHNNVTILPGAVIRADNDEIVIGPNTNIQDGAVLHTDPNIPMSIGSHVTIAHNAMLHGCCIGDNSVIAIGAVVMNNATIGDNCIIGANSVILENQVIPDGALVVGSPGKIKSYLSEEQKQELKWFAQHYVEKITAFKEELKPISLSAILEARQ